MLDSGAQRLRPGFLRRKARGKALPRPCFAAAKSNLLRGEHAAQKSLAVPLDRTLDARHFNQVDSSPHQHEATVAQQKTFSRAGMRHTVKPLAKASDGASVRESSQLQRDAAVWDLNLSALCADDAPRTVRFLTGAVLACGGNVLSRRFDPGDTAAIEFEFLRATCVEMYSLLIAAGLELTAHSHWSMATLCQCTRETLESTASDPVRVELTIRSVNAPQARSGAPEPPRAA